MKPFDGDVSEVSGWKPEQLKIYVAEMVNHGWMRVSSEQGNLGGTGKPDKKSKESRLVELLEEIKALFAE